MASNTGSIRIIKRPPPAQVRHRLIRDQIQRELRPVGQAHVDERNKIVADFDTEIEFGYRVSATEKQITLSIMVENAEEQLENSEWTVGELWRALDTKGTQPHTIQPKKQGGRLQFQLGYRPHTRPVANYGGPGQATGETVTARQVNHPGFPPRKFSQKINKQLRKRYEKAISRGVLLGWRKIR